MTIFDLHCDTLSEMLIRGVGLKDNGLAIDLNKTKKFENVCITFAAYVSDRFKGRCALNHYRKLKSTFYNSVLSDSVVNATCADDVKKIWQDKKTAAVFSLENANVIGNDLSVLDELKKDNVRFITLTHNGDNLLASGVLGSNEDLTEFGKSAVERMNELGILPDLSHINEKGFYSVAEISSAPLLVTHSNLKAVKDNKRNLTNDQFKTVVKSGGVVGINFYCEFLNEDTFESIYKNISLMLDLGGEDNIAIGSDFDGAKISKELASIDKLDDLCNYLISKNIRQRVLDKIFYQNALRIIGERKDEL
ncbi:MAG: membrane dipeptidase [Acutalibacteraceae bacterium]|nr:membrane dipeptidase [Acutalibacteraceae bacterium]